MPDPIKTQVLVADDDLCVRQMMAMLLEDAGYGVLMAQDGAETLDILRASTSSLVVLLDWMMPRMSGEEVLQAVKEDPGGLMGHAFVLVTANDPTRAPRLMDLLHELAIPVLLKPFRLQQLLDIVDQLVHRMNNAREAVG